jgi:hypothetical protein
LLIAEALGQTDAANQLRSGIEDSLAPWLDGQGGDALRYDETYGGVIIGQGRVCDLLQAAATAGAAS